MRLIDADALMVYCNNQKVKTVDANDIARFPTINIMPVVHANWLRSSTYWVYCSNCGQEPPEETNIETNYCPNCGAKMDLEETP